MKFKVFLGFDRAESAAFSVCAYSIWRNASKPVAIIPLALHSLPWYHRPAESQSTDFTFSRFLVPFLSAYQGYSLFMDCDMLVRADIFDLFAEADKDAAVTIVAHDYTPKTETKFLGNAQVNYPRKNWSSVILFNNEYCHCLTPDYVNTAPAADLHRFAWIYDSQIATIGTEWNHLVGEYPPNPDAKIVHWTLGGPYFPEYRDAEFADEWRRYRDEMIGAGAPWKQSWEIGP